MCSLFTHILLYVRLLILNWVRNLIFILKLEFKQMFINCLDIINRLVIIFKIYVWTTGAEKLWNMLKVAAILIEQIQLSLDVCKIFGFLKKKYFFQYHFLRNYYLISNLDGNRNTNSSSNNSQANSIAFTNFSQIYLQLFVTGSRLFYRYGLVLFPYIELQ